MEPVIKYPNETIRAISEFLFQETDRDALGYCDLTIVMGNDYIDGTMREVRHLLDAGVIMHESRIILSGATGSLNSGKEKECIRMYRSGVEKFGISSNQMVLEDQATNSYQNLDYSKRLVENNRDAFLDHSSLDSFSRILIIGKAFMLRRAEMCARQLKYPMEKLVYYGTVDHEGRNIGKDTWWKSESASQRVFEEIERIGKYSVKGDLSIF